MELRKAERCDCNLEHAASISQECIELGSSSGEVRILPEVTVGDVVYEAGVFNLVPIVVGRR